jgi:hypothetical protein
MGLNYFASSPVLLPPQNASHHLMNHHHEGGAVLEPSPSAFQHADAPMRKFISKYPPPPSLNYLARSSNGIAGRKRSRGDIGDDNESELEASSRPIAVEPVKSKPEPTFGPGMTLIYPDAPALNISPESQSGTWMEQKADDATAKAAERPRLIARKSLRRVVADSTADTNTDGIDPIVYQLGIGWRSLTGNQASAIAGSETFIKKQFQLNDPSILLHHEGMGIYVVRSEPASAHGYWSQWWLFREDLKSCRFLCNDENDLFRRLNNKQRDERGNWLPDILAEGPEVFAKDVTCGGEVLPPANVASGVCDVQQQQPLQQSIEDVEMEGA